MYGKDLGAVKGKTVRIKSTPVIVETDDRPREIPNIMLSVDIMYLMGITYLVTVSRGFIFVTATSLSDRKNNTILKAIKQVMALYTGEQNTVEEVEFTEWNNPIHTLLANNEFAALKDEIEAKGTKVNITAKEEHVPEVERQIRVVKERAWAVVQTLPYSKMPKKMTIGLVQYIVYWLKNIPKHGQDYSPRDLILGEQKLDYKTVCHILLEPMLKCMMI
jgi:hypothetical protein